MEIYITFKDVHRVYWFVHLSMGQKGVEVYVILASWEYHFIRVHENLGQHPNNDILIYLNHIIQF